MTTHTFLYFQENDPQTTCWKGGAVLSILDSSQELWVSRNEWNSYGVRVLRERLWFSMEFKHGEAIKVSDLKTTSL